MTGNRDGIQSAYTTGLTSINGSHYIAPVKHCYGDSPHVEWLQQYHLLLGDVVGPAMVAAMNSSYLEFCNTRWRILNTSCFGRLRDTQSYFTQTQINVSSTKSHVGGTAGDVHTDNMDCSISYSMTINLLNIQFTTFPGYFCFQI